ncbi:hypothetical protein NERG_01841 [Nematocida ausubeli]|uniref:Glutathione peroxidase n=1 Tax=Nematocida ausubeli (strain ATCC PRA-371 / ERTm2) TaxID=1913371 RepID=H8ZE20_NEMA1|nr:hypothetical protein NERG_01841 [Nematocida ausubeli]
MEKKILISFQIMSILVVFFCLYLLSMSSQTKSSTEEVGFYNFKEKAIDGSEVDFSRYKGKVCLVVNTACKCGLAKNGFATIKKLQENFKDLQILLFPSAISTFIDQEKDSSEEIIEEIAKSGIVLKDENIVVFKKSVINSSVGIFNWLTSTYEKSGWFNIKSIKWNFTMFVVDKTGRRVDRHDPTCATYPNVEKSVNKFYSEL